MANVKKYDLAGMVLFRRPEGTLVKEDAGDNKTFYVVDSHRKKTKKITKQ